MGGKPRGRVFIPATALTLILPVTTWDVHGEQIVDKNFTGERRRAIKPPDWLVELPDFVGLALVIALLAALGWLILEYWLQNWGNWWFVMLGSACTMGILVALTGREVTAAVPEHDYPGFGLLFVYAYLFACIPLLILLGISLSKKNFTFTVNCFHKLKRFVKTHKNTLLAIAGVLVALGIASVIAEAINPGSPITEAIAVLTLAPLVIGAMGAVFASFVLIPFVIASLVIWFVLFRSADLVLRRKVYW